jgi:hypothetical protein
VASILDYTRAALPESWRAVYEDGEWGESGRPDVFVMELARAMSKLFRDTVIEDDITNEFVKGWLGDYIAWRSIPALIDYYMVRTRRNDSMQRGAGVTPLGGETSDNYDRVGTLKDQADTIYSRLRADWEEFMSLVGTLIRGGQQAPRGIAISTMGQGLLTTEPLTFEKAVGQRPRYAGFGVIYVEDQVAPPHQTPRGW